MWPQITPWNVRDLPYGDYRVFLDFLRRAAEESGQS
jgi:hypothetical protein